IQQIGSPQDIYNEPKNAFVARFIGESNIVHGIMLADKRVAFMGREYECVDGGFEPNEPVDVVVRPEDIKIREKNDGIMTGVVETVTFKGVHYEMIVNVSGVKWMIHSTNAAELVAVIGMEITPEDIHIMKKSEYSEIKETPFDENGGETESEEV
ncbi:MAG: TOBE domain-containing protein, partial [Clostridia bacterium]|nr:TOBE domain-containing protein [Clostridia bacterium]